MAKITGVDKAKARIERMAGPEKIAFVGKALFVAGQKIKAEAQHNITAGSVSGKNHRPSAPGQAPHNDTGHLKDNITVTQIGPLHVRVASNAIYSAIHEFGGTIEHPGGTAFFVRDGGLAVFVTNQTADRFSAIHGRQLPRTKPHSITMPARPFMGPAARTVKKEVKKLVGDAISIALKGRK